MTTQRTPQCVNEYQSKKGDMNNRNKEKDKIIQANRKDKIELKKERYKKLNQKYIKKMYDWLWRLNKQNNGICKSRIYHNRRNF